MQQGLTAVLISVGSEEARLRASLRPPLKLHVQFSRMQLSRRLSPAGMPEKELSRATEQARIRHKAWPAAAGSSQRCANAYTDATRAVAGSSRQGDKLALLRLIISRAARTGSAASWTAALSRGVPSAKARIGSRRGRENKRES